MTTIRTTLPSSSNITLSRQQQLQSTSSPATTSYEYGDEGQRQDMNIITDSTIAIQYISKLKLGDCAFIKRTTGQWTYAIVKDITMNDNITFIVDKLGMVKSYKMKYWSTHIRTMKK